MKKLLLPLLVLGLAIGVGLLLRSMDSELTGRAIGVGEGRIEVYRTGAGRHFRHSGMSGGATWGSVRFAQVISENDPQIGAVRFQGPNIIWQRFDSNTQLDETVDIFSLNGDPATLGLPAEVGEITVAVPGYDAVQHLAFSRQYVDPVVFVMVKHYYGGQPITARAQNVTPTGADIVLTEPQAWDGPHSGERVHYLVIEAGVHSLPDGRVLEVGKAQRTTAGRGYNYGHAVTLQQPTYGDPVIITTIQNSNRTGFMGTRVKPMNNGTHLVTGFQVRFAHEGDDASCLPGADACPVSQKNNNTVGYLAYGTPWTELPGRFGLYEGNQGNRLVGGFDTRALQPGACIELLDTDFGDGERRAIRGAAEEGRQLSVIPYPEPGCGGGARQIEASETTEWRMITWDDGIKSLRVMHHNPRALTNERRTWGEDEPIVQTDFETLVVKNGELRLYRHLPADGAVWELWSTDFDGNVAEARFNADGSFSLHAENGDRSYRTSPGNGVSGLAIDHCLVQTLNSGGNTKTVIGGADCRAVTLPPVQAMPAAPDLEVGFADLDSDGHEELLLIVHFPAGNGVIMYDPLGLIDLLGTYRVPLPDDLWTLLSPTQRDALLANVPEDLGYGDTIERNEAEDLRVRWQWTALIRPWDVIHYNGRSEGSAVEVGTETPIPTVRIDLRVGNYRYEVDRDEYGTGFIFEASLIQVEYSALDGTVRLTATGPAAGYAIDIDDNGFTVGAQAQVAGVAFGVGDPEGSNIGMSADVGTGFWADAAFGRGGQYGYSIQVPIIPVGLSLYVHKDDALMVADFAEDWGQRGLLTSRELAEWGWAHARDFTLNQTGSMKVRFDNTYDDTRVTLHRYTDAGAEKVRMAVGQTSNAVITVIDDVAQLAQGMQVLADSMVNGVESAMNTVSDWANQTGDFATDVAGEAFAGAKKLYKKIKFW